MPADATIAASTKPMHVDVLLVGGGVAGLWALDALCGRGLNCVLAESGALGAGQTVASQGIVHGGLKYTLAGLLTGSAENIREMPGLWRRCVAGTPDLLDPAAGEAGGRHPDLSATPVRAAFCHLWRSESLAGRVGMIGAKVGLRVAPEALPKGDVPPVLRGVRGPVCALAEQVLSPVGFLENLRARNLPRLLRVAPGGVSFTSERGRVTGATLTAPGGRTLALAPRHVALTAGAGNAELLAATGLADLPAAPKMQRRPLHMALVRGDRLPPLNGHCVDGAKTRVTVTSDADAAGRTVWQIGGQLAEDGVRMTPDALIAHADRELRACVPGVDFAGCDWATYRVDRAEGAAGGVRPDDAQLFTVGGAGRGGAGGNVHACWPTKLALAPVLAARLAGVVSQSGVSRSHSTPVPADWPRPVVAAPPWETAEWAALPAARPLRRAA